MAALRAGPACGLSPQVSWDWVAVGLWSRQPSEHRRSRRPASGAEVAVRGPCTGGLGAGHPRSPCVTRGASQGPPHVAKQI